MTSDPPKVQLIGFEKDSELAALLTQVGLFQDYKATLPDRLLVIFRQQHPTVVMESIELLAVQKCKLGGIKQEQSETLVTVQTLDVPLDLRVTLCVGHNRLALDVHLILKYEELDSTPSTRTDMFVRAQKKIV